MNKKLLASTITLSLMGASMASQATTVTFTPVADVTVNAGTYGVHTNPKFMVVSNTGDVLTQTTGLDIVALHDGQISVLDTCAQGDIAKNKIMLSGDNKIAFWRCDSRIRGATKVDGSYVGKTVTASGASSTYGTSYDFGIAAKNGRVYNIHEATGGQWQGLPRVGIYNEETERFEHVVLPEEYNAYHVRSFSADGTHALISYGQDSQLMDLATFDTVPYQPNETEYKFNTNYLLIANDEESAVGTIGSCNWVCDTSAVLWNEITSTGEVIVDPIGFQRVDVYDASSDLSTVIAWGLNEEPTIWNAWTGELRNFEQFALQYGANFQGWSDLKPIAISENGLFITGVGTDSTGESNKAFIVEIDPTAECTYTY